jgi:hypothetical protein
MKKRTLTPEQIAARDARRLKFRALVKQVAALSDEQRAALVMQAGAVVTCEGRALSPRNTILLFYQLPGVSVVGGFRQWIKAGRAVRKGQHGGTISIPLGSRSGDGSAEVPAGEGDGESMHFGTATVFDIAQTDELGAESPVAIVSPEIADAFGMRDLPNVRIDEEAADPRFEPAPESVTGEDLVLEGFVCSK